MKYLRNNLEYRIITSKHLSSFKDSQSFIFDQLINGKYKFSTSSRELVLILYDLWFKWLLFVEQKFVNENIITPKTVLEITDQSDKSHNEILNLTSDSTFFDQTLISNWYVIHAPSYKLFRDKFNRIETNLNSSAFVKISVNLIKYLNYSLFELHEIDSLIYSNHQPFLCIDDLNYFNTKNECPELVINRAKLYKSLNYKFDKIKIKNYCTKSPVSESLLATLKQENIEVVTVE